MRKGIVVEIENKYKTDHSGTYKYTSKMNRIKIEHKDGTISKYLGFNKEYIFVKLGQTVYPQNKLGVFGLFDNTEYRLYFDVSYLKKVDFKGERNMSTDSNNVNPYFYSEQRALRLNANMVYTVEMSQYVFLKEFTRREKIKYKKNKLTYR